MYIAGFAFSPLLKPMARLGLSELADAVTRIALIASKEDDEAVATIRIVCQAFGVQIEIGAEHMTRSAEGIIFLHPDASLGRAALSSGISSLLLVGNASSTRASRRGVHFGKSDLVPITLRDRRLSNHVVEATDPLVPSDSWVQLASAGGDCAWAAIKVGNAIHAASSLILPAACSRGAFFRFLGDAGFLALVPLIDFIAHCRGDREYIAPPPRACLVLDDPNLHSERYGFVDYKELARSADLHSYHTAIATIPLDTFYASRHAVALFRNNPKRLSLIVHGNNHSRGELLGTGTKSGDLSLVQQVLSRVRDFETATALEVDRIMAPPHGACSQDMMLAMASLGFEALCASYGAVARWNGNSQCVQELAGGPEDIIGGLPLIPRFGFTGDLSMIALGAALLGRPIVFSGHHQDLRDGMEVLESAAMAANSVSGVQWAKLKQISQAQYWIRENGSTFSVRMGSRHIRLRLPEGVRNLCVDRPWLDKSDNTRLYVRTPASDWKACRGIGHKVSLELSGQDKGDLELACEEKISSPSLGFAQKPGVVMAIGRRFVTEIRDRLQPLLSRGSDIVRNREPR